MSDEIETIDKNPKSWAAWKREAERLQGIIDGMTLATMDSEPVAEVVSIYGDPEAFGEREIRPLIGIQQMPYGTKLYRHAQPAPVVPDELNTRTANDVMNEHLSWKDYGDAEVFCIAWNACRAAMLAAAPQSPRSHPAVNPLPCRVNGFR